MKVVGIILAVFMTIVLIGMVIAMLLCALCEIGKQKGIQRFLIFCNKCYSRNNHEFTDTNGMEE